ncbi:hypothetical protein P7K49_025944 [Saguinus oedipus]|uniref:Beta/gamma crystallin 'Greek key' domain-containing protein n=1 Tax=Saguinus oedipus TaxID=9490 RepID=A0ABQ9UJG7_SAGOE|nr:hypothetical protein P7K49_025944 [Saguinus oedipus]
MAPTLEAADHARHQAGQASPVSEMAREGQGGFPAAPDPRSLTSRWVLYEEPNYHSCMYVVDRGDFRSFCDWEAHSARVQSLCRVVNFF